jgi:hypothetical protein
MRSLLFRITGLTRRTTVSHFYFLFPANLTHSNVCSCNLTWTGGNFIIVYKKLTTIFNSGIVMNDKAKILNDVFGSLELRFLK